MEGLNPCPSCNNSAMFEKFCGWWHPFCPSCGFRLNEPMPGSTKDVSTIWGYNTKQQAIIAWNRRAKE